MRMAIDGLTAYAIIIVGGALIGLVVYYVEFGGSVVEEPSRSSTSEVWTDGKDSPIDTRSGLHSMGCFGLRLFPFFRPLLHYSHLGDLHEKPRQPRNRRP